MVIFVSESVGDRRSQPCTTFGCAEAEPILGNESRKRSSASPTEGWRCKVEGLSGPPTEPLEKLRFSDQSGSARFTTLSSKDLLPNPYKAESPDPWVRILPIQNIVVRRVSMLCRIILVCLLVLNHPEYWLHH